MKALMDKNVIRACMDFAWKKENRQQRSAVPSLLLSHPEAD
jgi:hypothetical protein